MGHGHVVSQRQSTTKSTDDLWGDMAGVQQAAPLNAQDDLWGSFEAVPQQNKTPLQDPNMRTGNYAAAASLPMHSKPGIIRRSTLDLFS